MLRRLIVLLLAAGAFLTVPLSGDQIEGIEVCKKYTLSICAVLKNKIKDLNEWVDYHRFIGVDHFYLYNLSGSDAYEETLNLYIDGGIVTLVNWPGCLEDPENDSDLSKWALSSMIPAFENAVNFLSKGETEWLFLVDVNEYIACAENNIKNYLNKYHDYSSILISLDYFDARNQNSSFKNSFTKALEEETAQEISVKKMIFKPEACSGFIWPPYQCCLKAGHSSTNLSANEIVIKRFIEGRTSDSEASRNLNQINQIARFAKPIYMKPPQFFKFFFNKKEESATFYLNSDEHSK